MDRILKRLFEILGIESAPVSNAERIVSAVGGFLGILCIAMLTPLWVSGEGAAVLLASMGASAVLLFAVPHGQLSQPWAVFGGHVLSAIIGVSCARWVQDVALASACAVGLAILAMYYLRCLHPPGGATAFAAVIGDESTRALGYQFVVTPVMADAVIILAVAIAFNAFFSWRRYPLLLARKAATAAVDSTRGEPGAISHEDFVFALSQIDSFVDVSEEDLLRIYKLATDHSKGTDHATAR